MKKADRPLEVRFLQDLEKEGRTLTLWCIMNNASGANKERRGEWKSSQHHHNNVTTLECRHDRLSGRML